MAHTQLQKRCTSLLEREEIQRNENQELKDKLKSLEDKRQNMEEDQRKVIDELLKINKEQSINIEKILKQQDEFIKERHDDRVMDVSCDVAVKPTDVDSTRKKKHMVHSNTRDGRVWQCNNQSCPKLSEKYLSFVADRVGPDWKKFMRHVGIKEYSISNVDDDYKNSPVSERAYQGFQFWIRQSRQHRALCIVFEILEDIGRVDVIKEMNQHYPQINGISVFESKPIPTTPVTWPSRKDEIQKIRKFCDKTQTSKCLLFIAGLPGNGKRSAVMEALSSVENERIVQPNFFTTVIDRRWTLDEFFNTIMVSWKADIDPNLDAEVNISSVLNRVQKPIILVLHLGSLIMKSQAILTIWSFIHNISRSNSTLKIIVTCSRPPQVNISYNTYVEGIYLVGFNEEQSIDILKTLNPVISLKQCQDIFKVSGGSPLLLRTLSAKIKSFSNFSEEIDDLISQISDAFMGLACINRLVRNTIWAQRMKNVLEMMDECERIVLAKLCVFIDLIPTCSLGSIYGDSVTSYEADYLCSNHCILEKAQENHYRISPIYRAFIEMYIGKDTKLYTWEDEMQSLDEIKEDSNIRVETFYLSLLVRLSNMYFSKLMKYGEEGKCGDILISEYRKNCKVCKTECQCSNHLISKLVFVRHRDTIIKCLRQSSSTDYVNSLLQAPFEIHKFLKIVMNKRQFMKLLHTTNLHSDIDDEINRAIAFGADSLLKSRFNKGKEEKIKSIKMLSKCIDILEKEVNLSTAIQTFLLLCYLKRAHIQACVLDDELAVKNNLEKAKKIYSTINISEVGKIRYHGIISYIKYHFREYELAQKHSQVQLQMSIDLFGDHPLTARAYYYLGKSQAKINTSIAAVNFKKAKEMYDGLNAAEEKKLLYPSESDLKFAARLPALFFPMEVTDFKQAPYDCSKQSSASPTCIPSLTMTYLDPVV